MKMSSSSATAKKVQIYWCIVDNIIYNLDHVEMVMHNLMVQVTQADSEKQLMIPGHVGIVGVPHEHLLLLSSDLEIPSHIEEISLNSHDYQSYQSEN